MSSISSTRFFFLIFTECKIISLKEDIYFICYPRDNNFFPKNKKNILSSYFQDYKMLIENKIAVEVFSNLIYTCYIKYILSYFSEWAHIFVNVFFTLYLTYSYKICFRFLGKGNGSVNNN